MAGSASKWSERGEELTRPLEYREKHSVEACDAQLGRLHSDYLG